MMYGWGGNVWGIGGWILMAVMMILFWGAVVAGAIYLRRRGRTDREPVEPRPTHTNAEQVLNERFARGEIDEAEYRSRRAVLRD
ncbi:hypothetical protein BH09ACT6_BH09ACT6_01150 [soil metagenome]